MAAKAGFKDFFLSIIISRSKNSKYVNAWDRKVVKSGKTEKWNRITPALGFPLFLPESHGRGNLLEICSLGSLPAYPRVPAPGYGAGHTAGRQQRHRAADATAAATIVVRRALFGRQRRQCCCRGRLFGNGQADPDLGHLDGGGTAAMATEARHRGRVDESR